MIYKLINKEFPEKVRGKFCKNGWISHKGVFYGFEGALHSKMASYIGIIILGKSPDVLNHATFFKDSWESYLLCNKWISIKDTSWLNNTIIGVS